MSERLTPYQRLLDLFREYLSKVEYPTRMVMWIYPKDDLGKSWSLDDLYQRTLAAEQLGFNVVLRAEKDGLKVEYRKKPPERPYNI